MIDSGRDLYSYTAGELSEMSRVELAQLAVKADEESAALWREHHDARGDVPPGVEERARQLSRFSDLFAFLAKDVRP
jgi:hypothetical protein